MSKPPATPEEVIRRFAAVLMAGVVDELSGLFERDAVVLPAAGGPPLRGVAATALGRS